MARPAMERCIALAFLALLLAAVPVPVRPVQYQVGNIPGNPNWFPHPYQETFYQDWADSLTLYVNDSLCTTVLHLLHKICIWLSC